MLDSGRCRLIQGHGPWLPAGYRGFRRRAGHGGCPRYLRRPTTAGVVPRAPQRSPTRCKTGTPPRFHRHRAGFCSRARVGSATAVLIDGNNSAGELAAPHIQSEARKLKLTLKTDACLRPGSVLRRQAPSPRSIKREERARRIVGGFAQISDRHEPRAPIAAGANWPADDGGRRAAPRLRRAAELGHSRHAPPRPRAARPSPRATKHDFAPALLKPPGGTARPRGCPRGLSHSQERPSPEFGVQGQPPSEASLSDIGRLLRKVEKAGNAPPMSSPGPHTF